jgi:hypothetical protein
LELAGLGQEGAGNAREKGARSFEPSGSRAPTEFQEARKLELSGGVRSLPQAPWWNADRRARPHGRVPRPFFFPPPQAGEDEGGGAEVVEQRLSAFRFPVSLFLVARVERSETWDSLARGSAAPDFACAQSGLRSYPRKIVMAIGPTTGAI